jgi:hypothetical protein
MIRNPQRFVAKAYSGIPVAVKSTDVQIRGASNDRASTLYILPKSDSLTDEKVAKSNRLINLLTLARG